MLSGNSIIAGACSQRCGCNVDDFCSTSADCAPGLFCRVKDFQPNVCAPCTRCASDSDSVDPGGCASACPSGAVDNTLGPPPDPPTEYDAALVEAAVFLAFALEPWRGGGEQQQQQDRSTVTADLLRAFLANQTYLHKAINSTAVYDQSYVEEAVITLYERANTSLDKPLSLRAVAASFVLTSSRALVCPKILASQPASSLPAVTGPGCPCNLTANATYNRCPVGHACSERAYVGMSTDVLFDPVAAQLRGVCLPCSEGFSCGGGVVITPANGLTRRTRELDCPAGSYCPSPGEVFTCPPGYYCGFRSLNRTSCNYTELLSDFDALYPLDGEQDLITRLKKNREPIRGNYCPEGSTKPSQACSAGYYCPNASVQLICPSGYYCKQQSIYPVKCPRLVRCPEGTAAPDGRPLAGLAFGIILVSTFILYYGLKKGWKMMDNLWQEYVKRNPVRSERVANSASRRHSILASFTSAAASARSHFYSGWGMTSSIRTTVSEPLSPKDGQPPLPGATSEPLSPKDGQPPLPGATSEPLSPKDGQPPLPGATSEPLSPKDGQPPLPGATSEPLSPKDGQPPLPRSSSLLRFEHFLNSRSWRRGLRKSVDLKTANSAPITITTSGMGDGGHSRSEGPQGKQERRSVWAIVRTNTMKLGMLGAQSSYRSKAEERLVLLDQNKLQYILAKPQWSIPKRINISFENVQGISQSQLDSSLEAVGPKSQKPPNPNASSGDNAEGVTGIFEAGHFSAIMGPSGCGKTTLLLMLSGRKPAKNVQTLSADIRVSLTQTDLRRRLGFVPQDDILHSDLTIRENIVYAAWLKLPRSTSGSERTVIVADTLEMLSLPEKEWDKAVGNPERKVISGGQRKRVSIGVEIVGKPPVLFMDEPTSGLDATTSMDLCKMLKMLAKLSRINIIAVIHQPRQNSFEQFDKVLLMAPQENILGRTVYLGPPSSCAAYFKQLGYRFPSTENVADTLLDIITGERSTPYHPLIKASEMPEAWKRCGEAWQKNQAGPVKRLAKLVENILWHIRNQRAVDAHNKAKVANNNSGRQGSLQVALSGLIARLVPSRRSMGTQTSTPAMLDTGAQPPAGASGGNGSGASTPAGSRQLQRQVGGSSDGGGNGRPRTRGPRASWPSLKGLAPISNPISTFLSDRPAQSRNNAPRQSTAASEPGLPSTTVAAAAATAAATSASAARATAASAAAATAAAAAAATSAATAAATAATAVVKPLPISAFAAVADLPFDQLAAYDATYAEKRKAIPSQTQNTASTTGIPAPATASCPLHHGLKRTTSGTVEPVGKKGEALLDRPLQERLQILFPIEYEEYNNIKKECKVPKAPSKKSLLQPEEASYGKVELHYPYDDIKYIYSSRERISQAGEPVQQPDEETLLGRLQERFISTIWQLFWLVARNMRKSMKAFWPDHIVDVLLLLSAAFIVGAVQSSKWGLTAVPSNVAMIYLVLSVLATVTHLRTFTEHKLVQKRERMAGVSVISTFLASNFTDLIWIFVSPAIYFAVYYYLALPRASFADYYNLGNLVCFWSSGLAYMISLSPLSAKNQPITAVIITLILGAFLNGLNPTLRSGRGNLLEVVLGISYNRWAVEAGTIQELMNYYEHKSNEIVMIYYDLGICNMDRTLYDDGRDGLSEPEVLSFVKLMQTFNPKSCRTYYREANIILFCMGLGLRLLAFMQLLYKAHRHTVVMFLTLLLDVKGAYKTLAAVLKSFVGWCLCCATKSTTEAAQPPAPSTGAPGTSSSRLEPSPSTAAAIPSVSVELERPVVADIATISRAEAAVPANSSLNELS
ncbi:hypothetical protein Agub_g14037 [Astrephomene gubernaculifera]|uniref:ABC transporter domain-containing protein n=1 Tax=Astrephomene gubernaculifera TaxID=47775 RepID=A0AAD3E0T2_9CHLO|nr:hypothetical protein Agub_g14037 [Astrephomene gubernaculifera]